MITVEELRLILNYDQDTGLLTWAKPRPKIRVGDRAGCLHHKGYRHMEIKGRYYACHRLVWLYVTGNWPNGQIDHINRDRDDNRFSNLREATNGQNRANCRSASKHGVKGVSFHPWLTERPWEGRVQYRRNGKRITKSLGCFPTKEEAHQAYVAEMRLLHPEHFAP